MPRRRLAISAAVGAASALWPHGHHVRPEPGLSALPVAPGGDFVPRMVEPESSRSDPLPPVTTTSTTVTSPSPSLHLAGEGEPAPVVQSGGPVVEGSPAAGRDLGTFEVTCYELTGTTASGAPAGPGSIAVDPSVIPLGTHLHVAGYGDGVADDTGGAVKGRHVDLWMTAAECDAWGLRYVDVEVAA